MKRLGNKLKRISREQLLALLAAVILAMASYFVSADQSFLKQGNKIERGVPGSVDKQYELRVKGVTDGTESLNVRVSPREFTEEEAQQKMEQLAEELSLYICGENENLAHVQGDLVLKKTIPGYEGIRLSWYPADPKLISYEGKISNLDLAGPTESSLNVVMKAGGQRAEYTLPVTVLPAVLDSEAELMEKLQQDLSAANENGLYDDAIELPAEVAGRQISYEVPPNTGWIRILALGILAFALLGLKPEQDRRQQMKKRETELLLDYSDVISKLVIYMGAGLTVKNAWIRITDRYQQTDASEPRAVYEEMSKTSRELEKGVPESKAFADFAGRCQMNCYLKMVSLLEQSRKTGDARAENALLLEAQESFEQRKNIARRLGEEAGTKLMLPLVISLITVMIIVAVPAMMTLA